MTIHAYVLIDCSASMTGAPLQALKQGVNLLIGTFISRSKIPTKLGMISYDSTAKEISKLKDVNDFEMPSSLDSAGSSALGAALRLVDQQVQPHDQNAPISTFVYIFTDGEPTDDWESALATLRLRISKVYVMACGIGVTNTALDTAVDRVYRVRELNADLLFETFRNQS
jgi:uncharacterized protein YegL